MKPPGRAGMMALPWILALAVILVIMGLTGSFQVSSTRRTIESIHARRLMDLAAQSALEEACSEIENSIPPVPFPPKGKPRPQDLGSLSFPAACQLKATPLDFAPDGITVDNVKLTWSAFRREEAPNNGQTLEREFGVLQLEVTLQMKTSFATLKQNRKVRRYVALEPNPGDNGGRFRVYPVNLFSEVTGG